MDGEYNTIITNYKNKIDAININMKKKYFSYQSPKPICNTITSFDDMYDILYLKRKKLDDFDFDIKYENNISLDISRLLKICFKTKYFDDNNFKYVSSHNKYNYFNPKENEKILYNSLRKSVYQHSDFRNDLYMFEDKLKKYVLENNNKYNNKYNVKINFFEDEEYTIVWMIIEISQNKD